MDSLILSASWDENSSNHGRTPSKLVAKLSGLNMQGARMKRGTGLEECNSDMPSWNPMPYCFLCWIAPGAIVWKSSLSVFLTLSIILHLIS